MDIKYKVIYSDRKTIGITVKDTGVVVRAPYKTSVDYIQKVVESHKLWIVRKLNLIQERVARSQMLTDEQVDALKLAAKDYFQAVTDRYSRIMGLKCGRIKITSAKKRFGSCNSNGNICFSFRLMLYPEAAREYVVVHELAHLVELNHSPRFYRIVEKYMPDYKDRKKLLG